MTAGLRQAEHAQHAAQAGKVAETFVGANGAEAVRILHQAGRHAEARLAGELFDRIFAGHLRRNLPAGVSSLQDLGQLRSFAGSATALALLDVPFALLMLLVLLAVHPLLALTSLLAALLIALTAWWTDRATRTPLALAQRELARSQQAVQGTMRHAGVVHAMGMAPALVQRWRQPHQIYLSHQAEASLSAGSGLAISKMIQTLQSSLLLGIGCWLSGGDAGGHRFAIDVGDHRRHRAEQGLRRPEKRPPLLGCGDRAAEQGDRQGRRRFTPASRVPRCSLGLLE
jgi:ABC-type protease/lipase transport system fused ATPase/permease subunit